MKILVTGTAGFIGYHLTKQLCQGNNEVIGVDVINDYYDIQIKYGRLKELGFFEDKISYGQQKASDKYSNLNFLKIDLSSNVSPTSNCTISSE